MEAVHGMVWIFSGIAQCDPMQAFKREEKGDFGCKRSSRGAQGRRDGNTSKNAIAFYVINIHQMNVKILTGQASKHVNHGLNSLIQLVKINIMLFQ